MGRANDGRRLHTPWIADFGLQPVLVGGNSPREHAAAQIIVRLAPCAVPALGTGLRALVGILEGAALALAPDTGPLHMAVALDRPVIGLSAIPTPNAPAPTAGSRIS